MSILSAVPYNYTPVEENWRKGDHYWYCLNHKQPVTECTYDPVKVCVIRKISKYRDPLP